MSFQNLNIVTRLGLGFGALIVLAIGLGTFSLFTMGTLAALTENLHEHPMAVTNAAADARGNILAMRLEIVTAALSEKPEEIDVSARRIDQLEAATYDDFNLMLNRFLGDKAQIQRAFQTFKDWKPFRDQVLALAREGQRDEAMKVVRGPGGQRAEAARTEIKDVNTWAQQKGDDFYRSATLQRDNAIRITCVILATIFVLALLVALLITRSITRPVARLRGAMVRLAEGDHGVEIPFTGLTNEIGAMAGTVQVFKEIGVQKLQMDAAERQRQEDERQAAAAQRDREQQIGQEIAALIAAVGGGDLSRRVDLAGKDGFYRAMSEGINSLTDTVEAIITDLTVVAGALAEGDLSKRITKDYLQRHLQPARGDRRSDHPRHRRDFGRRRRGLGRQRRSFGTDRAAGLEPGRDRGLHGAAGRDGAHQRRKRPACQQDGRRGAECRRTGRQGCRVGH
jgi:HAMP domain-containing protein